jgi:adenosylhomocysteine nucleosidase
MSFDGGVGRTPVSRVAIVTALGVEKPSLTRALRRTGGGWHVLQSGPGPERAAQVARAALAGGAAALVSWGLVGALDAALGAGDVVLPRRVLRAGAGAVLADPAWHARLAAIDGFRTTFGDLLTVDAALESPEAKGAAARATGCVAVDMEAAAIGAVAAAAKVPFVAVRVVVDTLADRLPAAEDWIDERGNRRFAAALRAVVRPTEWRALLTLGQRYRVASGVLERLAQAAAASGAFGFLDAPSAGVGG